MKKTPIDLSQYGVSLDESGKVRHSAWTAYGTVETETPQPQNQAFLPTNKLEFAGRALAVTIGASLFINGVTNLVSGCRTVDEKTGETKWNLISAVKHTGKTALGAAAIYASVTQNPVASFKSGYQSFASKIQASLQNSPIVGR